MRSCDEVPDVCHFVSAEIKSVTAVVGDSSPSPPTHCAAAAAAAVVVVVLI